MNPIDLGQTPNDMMKATGGPMAAPGAESEQEQEPNYPELNIQDHPDAAIANFPEHGTSIIKHSVIKRSTAEGKDGKKRHSLTLKIHSIKPHKGRPSKKKGKPLPGAKDDEDAIDHYMDEQSEK